jgi:vacuolar protein sorting-associated protein 13A/C
MKEVMKVEKFRQERELYGLIIYSEYFEINFFFQEKNKRSPHHKDTFFERLQFHILRNLEISIKNIHIAYEDKTTKSYPFQFGINLHSIKLHVTFYCIILKCLFLFKQTTNSEWKDVVSEDDSPIIYKVS